VCVSGCLSVGVSFWQTEIQDGHHCHFIVFILFVDHKSKMATTAVYSLTLSFGKYFKLSFSETTKPFESKFAWLFFVLSHQ
jgi:hypothetical protein